VEDINKAIAGAVLTKAPRISTADTEIVGKWSLSSKESSALRRTILKRLQNSAWKVLSPTRIHGNLDDEPFSPDGTAFVFRPGERAESNGNHPQPLAILDYNKKSVRAELKGHTDAIMWAGFNHSSTLVGTASWDSTFRLFNAQTGDSVQVFKCPGRSQNWTAGFSPDDTMFAGTMGSGKFAVWHVQSAAKIVEFEFGAWCRTLNWSSNSRFLAVGGEPLGKIMVVEPCAATSTEQIVQNRTLSVSACKGGRTLKRMLEGSIEIWGLQFLENSNTFGYIVGADGGLELYDIDTNKKWRFAPELVNDGEVVDNDSGPWLHLKERNQVISADGKTIRFWDLA